MEDKDFGPWIVWGKGERPKGLRDDQRVQVVFINPHGELGQENYDRSVKAHLWEGHSNKSVTLAYRVKSEEETHVISGRVGTLFGLPDKLDTHKITYVLDGAGEVVSCKMEKL